MKHLGCLTVVGVYALCTTSALGTTIGVLPSEGVNAAWQQKSQASDALGPEIRDGDKEEELTAQSAQSQASEAPASEAPASEPPAEAAPASEPVAEAPVMAEPLPQAPKSAPVHGKKRPAILPPAISIPPPSQDMALKDTELAGGVVRRPLLRSKTVPEIGVIQKPKVADIFKEHLFKFQKDVSTDPDFPNIACSDVVDELQTQPNTIGAYLPLKLFLSYLNTKLLVSNSERVNADKEAEVSLRHVKEYMVSSSGDSMSGDLVLYMERLIRCKLPPMEDGRGMYQMMIRLGYAKAMQSLFAWYLALGLNDYDPAMVLDAYGNTLLHLAVMSEAFEVPGIVLNFENRKNFGLEKRKMNSIYWVLSALEVENDDGMKPFQLAKDGNMVRKLKEIFRNNSNFLKFLARDGGVPLDLSDLSEMQHKIDTELDAQAAAVGLEAAKAAAAAAVDKAAAAIGG